MTTKINLRGSYVNAVFFSAVLLGPWFACTTTQISKKVRLMHVTLALFLPIVLSSFVIVSSEAPHKGLLVSIIERYHGAKLTKIDRSQVDLPAF